MLTNTVRREGSVVEAQALADHPALHSWVEAVFEKHLEKKPKRMTMNERETLTVGQNRNHAVKGI